MVLISTIEILVGWVRRQTIIEFCDHRRVFMELLLYQSDK